MALLGNNVSDIRFSSGSIDHTNTSVVRFHGREALSEISRFVIDLATKEEDIKLDAMVGKEALLCVIEDDGDQRLFHGIINRFEMIGHTGERTDFRAEIVPKLWLLTQRQRSFVYQNETTGSILKTIFTYHGLSMASIPDGLTREYCVQYNETDYAFCCRLMEEDGLFFHHTHEETDHIINIEENAAGLEEIGDGSRIEFKETHGGSQAEEFIYKITMSQEIRPGKVVLRDFDFVKPSTPVDAEEKHKLDNKLEVYCYPGEYGTADTAKRWAKTRLEEYNAKRQRTRGASSVRRFAPGFFFTLDGHPWSAANQKYLLTAVEHRGSQKDALPGSGGDPELNYENNFECQPAAVEYKAPRITPRPRISGTQTAIVTGPPNEEVYTDKYGRVTLHFHWDREGPKDNTSSLWVRVSQGWAGAGWGAIFIPRIGQEVLVDFENGDPDRPMVTGRVYNGENAVPYPLPGEKTKSTIKSNSSIGGGGFNEIRFEDATGSEEIYAHAQKDYNIAIENDRTKTVGHDETFTINNDQTGLVKGFQKLTVNKDRTKNVDGNQTETVVKEKTITVNGGHTETVGKDTSITLKGNLTQSVAKDMKQTITGQKVESVTKDKAVSVTGNHSESITGTRNIGVTQSNTINVTGAETVSVGQDQSITVSGKQGVKITGDQTVSAAKVNVTADSEIQFKTGSAKLVLKSGGEIVLEGSKITIKGSGPVVVKGSTTSVN